MPFLGEISGNLAVQAHRFLEYGWSVIPLRGDCDSDLAKAPALSSWRAYQRRLAQKSEVEGWFGFTNHSQDATQTPDSKKHAIGIVLGQVSNLIVIDIDDADRAQAFADQFPFLTETFTVISGNRHLPHYYFRITSDFYVPSRTAAGVELRSDGQYVVAPGSQINGNEWRIIKDIAPKILTQSDLRILLQFLKSGIHAAPINCKKPASDAFKAKSEKFSNSDTNLHFIDSEILVQRYRRLAQHQGRNNALFATAVLARDHGWSMDRVMQFLGPAHVKQTSATKHRIETSPQRSREAMATLKSVYSRPPRINNHGQKGLPNSVRERLLTTGCVNIARLLDAMLLKGIEAGHVLTVAEIYQYVGELGLGRNTIYAALKTKLVCGSSIFEQICSPPTPPSLDANAANRFAGSINQCLVDRVANPVKNRGRPSSSYRMPSTAQLCELFGVTDKGSDRLSAEDLSSPSAYRAALHAAFIRRAPGQYSRRWLAKRLGVSVDSCRRYERQRQIYVRYAYQSWDVTVENAEGLLPEYPEPGCFLEDERGKRYPPIPVLAQMLLGHGRKVVFRMQRSNQYSVTPPLSQVISPAKSDHLRAPWTGKQRRKAVEKLTTEASVETSNKTALPDVSATSWSRLPVNEGVDIQNCCGPQQFSNGMLSHISRSTVERDEPEAVAATIERVYEHIRRLSSERALTRQKTAALVEQYGCDLVARGLRVLESRRNVHNPAGFLITWLKSEKSNRIGAAAIRHVPVELPKELGTGGVQSEPASKKCCGPQHFVETSYVIEDALRALESQHRKWLDQIDEVDLATQRIFQ